MKKILIIGAGVAGEMVVKEIINHPETGYEIVGLIDDDKKKQDRLVYGKPVLGQRRDIVRVVNEKGVEEIIIAIPSAPGHVVREIVASCEKAKVAFKIVPGIWEIITGDVHLSQIREVKADDLLGRETVRVDLEEVSSYLSSKRVLVTGAGGSIGSELCRQVAAFNPSSLLLLDHAENNLYFLEIELKERGLDFKIIPKIADIRDKERLSQIFGEYRPEVIFHAAAHKHVPLMESNPSEAIKNNVVGSKNLMEEAIGVKAARFVLISTDKAVNPASIMGASKRISEMLMQVYEESSTKFMAVRFGNVLGSQGSVVPLFKKQIAAGGPVTVTHPEATRYFMTIHEAVSLIIQAGAIGQGQEVFLLDMGEPIKIVNLARDLITLSGFEPDKEIKITYTGLREGEKLYEELLTSGEGTGATFHKEIFMAKPDRIEKEIFKRQIEELAKERKKERIIEKVSEIIPDYKVI